jgi:murein L,D-transpeptidase YcbB/YkuD
MAMYAEDTLTYRSKGEDVSSLKWLLRQCGYGDHLDNSDVYDRYTEKAVMKFQWAQGLPAHGVADNETFDRLIALADKAT